MNIMQTDITIRSIILILHLLVLFAVVYSYYQSKSSLKKISGQIDTDLKTDSLENDVNK